MGVAMRWLFALVVMIAAARSAATPSPPGAELWPVSPDGGAEAMWRHAGPLPERLEVSLGLGDQPAGSMLALLAPVEGVPYRVWVQFETSLALGDAGPHLDFDDWKHCRSDWREAASDDGVNFVLPVPTEHEEACFPAVASEEIVEQTRRVLGGYGFDAQAEEHWLRIAREAGHAGGGQSYVAISTVRVRIEVRAPEGWRTLSILDFRLPMGC